MLQLLFCPRVVLVPFNWPTQSNQFSNSKQSFLLLNQNRNFHQALPFCHRINVIRNQKIHCNPCILYEREALNIINIKSSMSSFCTFDKFYICKFHIFFQHQKQCSDFLTLLHNPNTELLHK